MTQPMRLDTGGRIDRKKTVRFTFDGKPLTGCEGDTLASALLANGVHLVGRSFKYHRPRGILGADVEEPNALVGVTRGPGRFDTNRPVTTVALVDGLVVESQNRWPSLAFDLGALADLAAPLIPAGFYYKTFMWPQAFWHRVYEPRIRRMAGLGRAPDSPDPDRYSHSWVHCEVLIVGGGSAGLAAALAAAPSGKRVVLCDEGEEFGGALLSDPHATIDGQASGAWVAAALARLRGHANVRLIPRATAFSYAAGNMVALAERLTDHLPPGAASGPRERQLLVRAGQVIIATGAIERPIVFPNNDRPGIMLANAARTFSNRYGVLPGRRIVVCAAHDSGYRTAFDLAAAGATVAAIVDLRPEVPGDLAQQAVAAGIEVLAGHAPVDSRGRLRVASLAVVAQQGGQSTGASRWIACDLVLMAGGWTPSVHLFSQSRGQVAWDETIQAFLPGASAQTECSVGACHGRFTLAACLADGWAAGARATDEASSPPPTAGPDREDRGGALDAQASMSGSRSKAFVDFQNDVTSKDIRLAVREGFHSVEHIKRYTTTGMATDQGRTSNLNALAIASQALGKPIPGVGLTTFRAPYTPTTFGTLAGYGRGALFDPVRRTPTHEWAQAHGAVFEDVGQWKRARYFPQPGETMHQAVGRECRATRASVGMFDASTLGKIEVVGPDAGAFLDFMYINKFASLGVGRCRYGVMLREDGFIADDGVIGRLAPDRYHVTTTSGGAAGVLHMMEDFRQTEVPHLKVWLTSTTEHWAVIAVNGPKARDVIAPLVEGLDLSAQALPHMSIREARICGLAGRLFRVSFTGELGFEINVPASHGLAVWEAIHAAGQQHGVTPYGTETMHVLRAEKGYIIIGQETDGTVTPDDAGLSWAIGKGKADFVGKRSLDRPAMRDPDRMQLVGLLAADGRTVVEEGAQLIDEIAPNKSLGHVTSSYWSEALGHPVALALLSGGRALIGTTVHVAKPSGATPMRVVESVFFDTDGQRLHG